MQYQARDNHVLNTPLSTEKRAIYHLRMGFTNDHGGVQRLEQLAHLFREPRLACSPPAAPPPASDTPAHLLASPARLSLPHQPRPRVLPRQLQTPSAFDILWARLWGVGVVLRGNMRWRRANKPLARVGRCRQNTPQARRDV